LFYPVRESAHTASSLRIVHASDVPRMSACVNAVWPATISSGRISLTHVKETIVIKLNALLLATLFGIGASIAHADDAATKPKAVRTATTTPAADASAEPAKISQQEKMRLCSKQAKGKKGAERKDFMKTCLSKKA
jgi:hypothetical protein